ncbi:MAG TPA: hypothetical protein VHA35_18240 [Dongiaceae bacterium]|jgi:uncharacterized protein YjiS (DUF1127 family)|nr:hypothetical protein [Dongiaceae bacterium]
MSANTTLTHASSRRGAGRARAAVAALTDLLADAPMAVARWWQIRQDERLLRSQPDHLLRDVGIDRARIRAALRGQVER